MLQHHAVIITTQIYSNINMQTKYSGLYMNWVKVLIRLANAVSVITTGKMNLYDAEWLSTYNGGSQTEFPAQRPVTRSFDVFFDLRPNKRLNKPLWGWRFETLSPPLWRHCNDPKSRTVPCIYHWSNDIRNPPFKIRHQGRSVVGFDVEAQFNIYPPNIFQSHFRLTFGNLHYL